MSAQERELKFDISSKDIAGLEAHPLLREAQRSEHKHQRSVYFDTDEDDLWRAGAIVRVRYEGDRKVQTVKSGGDGGPTRREEDERDIDGDRPELSQARAAGPARLLKKRRIRERLEPRFEVDVDRDTWTLRANSAELEVALDRGKVVAGAAASELCEVEIELKNGDVATLYQTARRLGADVPLTLNLVSKGERGYLLLHDNWDRPQKAGSVPLERGMTAAVALRTIAADCMKQFLLNERLLRDATDPEVVHQARVAIRRLRAAFAFFKDLASDDQSASLKRELKWVSDRLGEARDLDVLKSDVIEAAKGSPPGHDHLRAEVESRRRAAYERLTEAIESQRFRRLLFDFAEWLDEGEWRKQPHNSTSIDEKIEDFAAREFKRRMRKLVKRALDLEELDDGARHRVRISAKKMRYDTEFFDGVYPRKAREKFRDLLEDMQATLGGINDRLWAHDFLAGLVQDFPRRDRTGEKAAMLFAAGEIGRDLKQADKDKLVRRAAKSARKLANAAPFWR